MPAALQYVDPNDKERKEYSGSQLGSLESAERARIFERNKEYYDGNYPEYLETDEETGINPNVVVNKFRQIVDRVATFIYPTIPKMVTDTDSSTQTPEEAFLEQAFNFAGGVTFFTKVVHNGAFGGHCFVRVAPPKKTREDGGKYPRLINIDPRRIQVFWDAFDMDNVLWYEQRWSVGNNEYIEDTVLNEEQERWDIMQYTRSGGGQWRPVKQTVWESMLSPIVDWQHLPKPNEYYGTTEMSNDVEHLNNTLNRVASDIGLILRYHASPKTVATGIGATEITQTSVDGLWAVQNQDAKVYNLEMESDLQSSMSYLDYINNAVLDESRTVILHGTVKDFQRVTNTGIRAVFLDMLSKNILLRQNYGEAMQKIARRMLVVGGLKPVRPTLVWSDPLPTDDLELVNTLAIERNMQIVSEETASRKRGYTWEDELERMKRAAKELPQAEQKQSGSSLGATDKNTNQPAP